MIFKFSKDFFLKKLIKKKIKNETLNLFSKKIKTIGLLIDEDIFQDKEGLISEFLSHGIAKENITTIVYKDKFKKNELSLFTKFSNADVNWRLKITNSIIAHFVSREFDLLVSYYSIEKVALLCATQYSKAHFKAGFSSIDNRLNHFMINTNIGNYKIFVEELFRYLKILNKV